MKRILKRESLILTDSFNFFYIYYKRGNGKSESFVLPYEYQSGMIDSRQSLCKFNNLVWQI